MKILDIQNGFYFELKASFIHDQKLVACKNNDSVNFLLTEFVELVDRLEIHDGVIWLYELLQHLLCSCAKILHF